ncbi:SCO family protein [Bordetella petrii]|nr:SCO family protein [Bordetella petrii]
MNARRALPWIAILALACALAPAQAQPLAFSPRLQARVPLDTVLVAADGAPARLGDVLRGQPALLVLGYYHCPRLCGTVMDGVIEGTRGVGVPFQIVALSIDPQEGPPAAQRKARRYRATLPHAWQPRLHLLTGAAGPTRAVADAVGFPYRYDRASGQFDHPAGFVVLTPQGRVSRYFTGVRYAPRDLELALVEASHGAIGTLTDQVVLFCSHYDPAQGAYTVSIMRLVRLASLALLLALGGFVLYWQRRPARRP